MKLTAYHGTNCKFDKFDGSLTTDDTNKIGEIWFTTDLSIANDYARTRTLELGGSENIIKAELTINNPMPTFLRDSIDQIFAYATKENELEEYESMYNNFEGRTTIDFAEYVMSEKYDSVMEDSSLLLEWGFDGTINDNMVTVFKSNQIEVIK
jgi:hypothetical protein